MPFNTKKIVTRYVEVAKMRVQAVKQFGANSSQVHQIDGLLLDLNLSMNFMQLSLAKSVFLEETGILIRK